MKREIANLINYKRNNFLLLDFCNLRDITHNAILDVHKKHRIIHTIDGNNKGYEESCFSKQDPDKRVWLLLESEETKRFKNNNPGFVILPSEKRGDEILRFLQESQIEYKNFLNKCIEGQFDLEFINKIIKDFSEIGLRLNKSIHEWTPSVVYEIEYLRTFESYIDWEILDIIFLHLGSIFQTVRACNWQKCRKYFLYKRKDQKYCSSNCSRNKRSFDYRKTGKHNEYMKKHSIKGVYIPATDR